MSLSAALAKRLAPLMPDSIELRVYTDKIFVGRQGTPFGAWIDLAEITAKVPARAGELPESHVRVSGDRLEIWFGTEDEPVLALPPIQL